MSTDKFKLIKNFLSLSSVQFANYILPFIAIPYIVRIVGPEKYGLISFAQAFVLYFSLFVNYGFNLSATREISANRENTKIVSEVFSVTLTAKFLLF
ncbi:MAG: oligosaccharide flippase family protein, partial [Candidatus Kryptonium sp.]|nr:oligosaccharide flippase family protein [Candidatus Kryptonium sp.]